MYNLCHKCMGVGSFTTGLEVSPLYYCSCISGWDDIACSDKRDAITKQIETTKRMIELYIGQKRDSKWIDGAKERLSRLETA